MRTVTLQSILLRAWQRAGNDGSDISNIPSGARTMMVAAALLAWLGAQLATGETLADVVIEPAGSVVTAYEEDEDSEAIPSEYRAVLSAAISVVAPLGSRTFIVSSENLPEELRDGLLQNFEALTNG
jgi:hypothetical protein